MRTPLPSTGDLPQRAFWMMPAAIVVAGVLAGLLVPLLDAQLAWTFVSRPESARAILATIATVTVSVAGVTFSIIVVALILASSQLSPRVMRTFRTQKLNQVVLGMFVGTFAYALLVLRTVGTGGEGTYVPDVSVVLAVALAIVAFGLFIAFIGQIVHALEASTIISRIAGEAHPGIESPYPEGSGSAPDDPLAARRRVERRMTSGSSAVRARSAGFLRDLDAAAIVEAAARHDALVSQEIHIGDYVLTGEVLALVWSDPARLETLEPQVRAAFRLEPERSPLHDIGFPVRQLADVALRAVSPSVNDPTTAENAMNALADTLIRIAGRPRPAAIRADREGRERFVARTPDLSELVRLGFEQVRVASGAHPVLCLRLLHLLGSIDDAAEGGCPECARQARLIGLTVADADVLDEDAAPVHAAIRRRFGTPSAGA